MRRKFERLRSNPAVLGWIVIIMFIWKVIETLDTLNAVVQYMNIVWEFFSTPIGMLILLAVGLSLIFYAVLKPARKEGQGKKAENTEDVFLKEVLKSNQAKIYEAIKGRIIGWRFSGINSPDPYFEICLEEINTSIFTIHFLGGSGSLFINGAECQQPPRMNEQWGLEQGKVFEVTVKQGVSKNVADIIQAASNNKQKVKFDLQQFHLCFETTTKGYEGFKPLIKFDREYEVQPNINTNLLILHKQITGFD